MHPPKIVLVCSLAAFGLLLGFGPRPASAGPGTLSFTPSQNAVTVDGAITGTEWTDAGTIDSSTGIEHLYDGTSVNGLSPQVVTVYTKFDATSFYVAFHVDDITSSGVIGDKVLLFLDPTNNKGANPAANYYLVDYTVPRGGSPSFLYWSQGTYAAGNGISWTARDPVADNVKVVGKDYPLPNNQPGYVVEIQIPFATVGYDPGREKFPNIGVAFIVLDDDSFQYSGQEVFTAVGFPDDSASLPLTDVTLPTHLVDQSSAITDFSNSNWNTPSYWGTGVLKLPPDSIFISRLPVFWQSQDIKTAFCTAASFADAGQPGAINVNVKWYQYQTVNPCEPLRMFSQIHRQGGLVPVTQRVLYVWAENGSNPQKWSFISITDPAVTLAPGLNGATTTLGLDKVDWASVKPGQNAHPCVQVYILPETLNAPNPDPADPNPVLDLNFFKSLGSEASAVNKTRINNFISAYGIPVTQWAQMNIELIAPFQCPTCPDIRRGGGGVPVPFPAEVPGRPAETPRELEGATTLLLPLENEPLSVKRIAYQPPGAAVVTTPPSPGAVADFTTFGVVPTRRRLRYTIFEPLGGVRKVVDLSYLREKRVLPLYFNVSNSPDYPRTIIVTSHLTLPRGVQGIGLRVIPCEPTFKVSQTKAVVAEIGPGVQSPPVINPTPPGKNPPLSGKPLP